MDDLRNLIERYVWQEYASIEIERNIWKIIKDNIRKRVKSLSFYFEENRTIASDKTGDPISPQIEALTNWVFTLCGRRKLKWEKGTEVMTAFEYIVFRKDMEPEYFLFGRGMSAIKTLLEQEIRKEWSIKKELLQTRDYIRKLLNKHFRKFPRGRYGLWKWHNERYDNKCIDIENLISIHISHILWNDMLYEERIQQILEEADCPLNLKQISTTYQRLEGLLVREEYFPQAVDKDGNTIDFIETKEGDGEIHAKFQSPAEDFDFKQEELKFNEIINGLSETEMNILKLKNYEALDKAKLRSDGEVATYFRKSPETIRLWRNAIFQKIQEAFPLYSDQKRFLFLLAEKLQNYNVKLLEGES